MPLSTPVGRLVNDENWHRQRYPLQSRRAPDRARPHGAGRRVAVRGRRGLPVPLLQRGHRDPARARRALHPRQPRGVAARHSGASAPAPPTGCAPTSLRSWPRSRRGSRRRSAASAVMVHGSPFEPHNEYIYPNSPSISRLGQIDADYVILGHTHYQMAERVGRVLVINPGSAGEARDARNASSSRTPSSTRTRRSDLRRLPGPHARRRRPRDHPWRRRRARRRARRTAAAQRELLAAWVTSCGGHRGPCRDSTSEPRVTSRVDRGHVTLRHLFQFR